MTSPLSILKMLYSKYITITKTPIESNEQNTAASAEGKPSDEPLLELNTNENTITIKSCRICLQEGSEYIFRENATEDLVEALNTIGGIDIKIDDSYPKYLCKPCLALLQGAMLFRKTAQQVDDKLKRPKNIKIELDFYDDTSDLDTYSDAQKKEETVEFEQPKKEKCSDATEHPDSTIISNKQAKPLHESKYSFTHKQGQEVEKSTLQTNDSNSTGKCGRRLEKKRKVKIYRCLTCKLKLYSFEEYIDHKLSHMPEIKRETCAVCNKMFPLWLIKKHMDTHKLASSKNNQVKNNLHQYSIDCDECNIKFKSLEEYKKHKLSAEHLNAKQLCTICNKSYKLSYIKSHMLTHESDKNFICDICGKGFKHVGSFNVHSATHQNIYPFDCTLCPYKARRKPDLRTHMRIHTGEKPYQCHECPQRFATKSNLNKHMWTHKTDGSFECDACGKKFRAKPQMTIHINTVHSGNNEHICQDCNNVYKTRKHLLTHQRRVHNREKLRGGRVPNHLLDFVK